MKKFYFKRFLTILCLIPLWCQAQELSIGLAEQKASAYKKKDVPSQQIAQTTDLVSHSVRHSTTFVDFVAKGTQSLSNLLDIQKLEQIKKTKSGNNVSKTFGIAPHSNSKAYNTNSLRGETSECLIAHNMDLYHFTLNNPAGETAYGTSGPEFLNCAEYFEGQYYIATSTSGMLLQVDPGSGAVTNIKTGNQSGCIAYNPADGLIYGLSLGNTPKLYIIDVATGEESFLRNVNSNNFMLGMTISNDGRCFIIDAQINGVSETDLATGDIVSSLPADFMVNYGQDMACDRETNKIYWAAYNATINQAQLYEIDFDGGAYNLIGVFSSQSSAFATMTVNNPNIPAAPTDFTVTPDPNQGLSCDLAWTNPTLTVGGETLSSITKIVVKRNGAVLVEFTDVTVGQSMTYTDSEVPEAGKYSYLVYAVNDEGNGIATSKTVTIGPICTYVVEMFDSWNDGWNGSAIQFTKEDGTIIANITLDNGAYGTAEVLVPADIINLVWVSSNCDNECSFKIYYPWNDIMYDAPVAPLAGIFYTWENTCNPPTCPRPKDFVANNISDVSVTLSWTEIGDATTWNIEYGALGFSHGEGTLITVTENPYTLIGLEPSTNYTLYVQAVCAEDDLSEWSAPTNIRTAIECPEGTIPTNVQIGNGTNGTYLIPVNIFWNYSYVQELYTNTELLEQGAFFGNINTISFQYFYISPLDAPIKIYMANTDIENLDGGWYLEGLTEVYNGTVIFDNTGTDNWVDIQLQNQFTYDGESNLLVVILYEKGEYLGPQNRFYTHTTKGNMVRHAYRDSETFNPMNPGVDGYTMTERNNTKFSMCITLPDYVTVSGTVTSTYTQQPIAGASLYFKGALGSTVTTDQNGEYSIDLVQGYSYNVTITATGYNTYTDTYLAPEEESATKDFAINQPDINLSPEEIVASAYFMQVVKQDVIINNPGTGKLTWSGKCFMDDEEKAEDSEAHVVIGGQEFYNFILNNPAGAEDAEFAGPEFMNSQTYMEGTYYFATSTSGLFGTIDYEAKAVTVISSGNPYGGIAYNPVDRQLYGCSLGAGTTVYTVDAATGEYTKVISATSSNFIFSITLDVYGRCFLIDAEVGGISEIDLTTGDFINSWSAGFEVNYGQDVATDFETNTIYWAAYNTTVWEAQLYKLNVAEGTFEMIGTFEDQASCFAIETIPTVGRWLTIKPNKGNIPAGGSSVLTVSMDGWRAQEGTFTGHVELTNNSLNQVVNIPVTLTIIATACNSVQNLQLEVIDFNNMSLTWEAPAEGTPVAYNIYYGEEHEPFVVVEDTYYVDENLKPGEYTYNVRAVYEDGCIGLCTTPVTGTATQPYRVVNGTVTSSLTNNTIANATVTFDGSTYIGPKTIIAITDENGNYEANVFVGTYTVTVEATGYNTTTMESLEVAGEAISGLDFALAQPLIEINPEEVNVTVDYMEQGVTDITITNNGNGELTWDIATNINNKAESSPAHIVLGGQEFYNFTLNDPAGTEDAGFAGPEFMNSQTYVDGIFYFSSGTSGLFGTIDYEAKAVTIISSNNPYGGIAYNPVDGQLYASSLGVNAIIYTVDAATGNYQHLVTVTSNNSVLGITFNLEGRCFLIEGVLDGIVEIDLTTGDFINIWPVGFDVNYGQDIATDFETNTIYWAAYNTDEGISQLYTLNIEDGTYTTIGTFADQASCFAIESSLTWLKAQPTSGVVAAGETSTFQLLMDGSWAEEGTFTGTCNINNNTLTPSVEIPVTFTINPPNCDPVQNFALEVVDFNTMHLTWDEPANPEGLIAYGVYHNDDKDPFATIEASETFYDDEGLVPGEYCYRVRAIYEDGCVSKSDLMLCGEATLQYGTVSGTITDAENGNPIAGATVRFSSSVFKAITNEDGTYSIDVVIGTYKKIIISAEGYKTLVIPDVNIVIYENTLDAQLEGMYAPVQNLAAEVDGNNVNLTWEAPIEYNRAENSPAHIVIGGNEFFNFTLNDPVNTISAGFSGPDFMNSQTYMNGTYYFATSANGFFGTADYEAQALTIISSGNPYGGIAYNPHDDQLYGCSLGYSTTIYTVDVATGEYTEIITAINENFMLGMTFDLDGRCFLIDVKIKGISEIDLITGDFINSWPSGFSVNYGQDIATDLETNTIYWAAYNESLYQAQLYKFYPENGTFELVGTFAGQASCFAIETKINTTVAELTGYQITRNNEVIATLDKDILSYLDENVPVNSYTYCVTALYEEHSSVPACVDVEMGLLGDANDDGFVDFSDIYTIIAYILQQNPQPFNFANADVNHDGVVNMADIQLVINIIMGTKGMSCEKADITYTIDNGILYMHTTAPVSAFQVALIGKDIEILDALKGYATAQGMTTEGYLFLAYNLNNLSFDAGTYALLKIGDATVNYFSAVNPCGELIDGKEGSVLGINDKTMEISSAYPNPFATTVKLPYNVNETNENIEFVITDMNGKIVYRQTTNSTSGIFEWTPENVTSGVYFINMMVKGIRTHITKVVYQK